MKNFMVEKPSLIFWGTPVLSAAILENLYQAGFPISCVVTKEDRPFGRGLKLTPSPVKKTALRYGLKVFTPANLNEPSFISAIDQFPVDFSVVSAYGKILPTHRLNFPAKDSLNIHYSLLPKWRGASPIHSALLNGDSLTGVSIISMNEKMDEGDILLKKECLLSGKENFEELTETSTQLAQKAVREVLIGYDLLKPEAQNHTEATYSVKIKPEDSVVNWQAPAKKIFNQLRAFSPKPGLKTGFRKTSLRIQELTDLSDDFSVSLSPGQLKIFKKKRLFVGTGDLPLEILQVQPEGKNRQKAIDFINGTHLGAFDRLT